jgi:hypothetical protein
MNTDESLVGYVFVVSVTIELVELNEELKTVLLGTPICQLFGLPEMEMKSFVLSKFVQTESTTTWAFPFEISRILQIKKNNFFMSGWSVFKVLTPHFSFFAFALTVCRFAMGGLF